MIEMRSFSHSLAIHCRFFSRAWFCFACWCTLWFRLIRWDVFLPVLLLMHSPGNKHFRVGLLWLIICEGRHPPRTPFATPTPIPACAVLAAYVIICSLIQSVTDESDTTCGYFLLRADFAELHALKEAVGVCKIVFFSPSIGSKKARHLF